MSISKIKFLAFFSAIFCTSFLTAGLAHASEPCSALNIRWSATNNRIYISGDVYCSLNDIKTLGPKAIPLTLINSTSKIWFLGSNIVLQNGAMLIIKDSQLLLKSNNDSPNNYVSIMADWGKVKISKSKVTSWDEAVSGPDTNFENGRAFIRVRSRIDSNGITPRESSMDIHESEISYLGFNGAESYGLSWKVLTNSLSDYNKIGVYGEVMQSKIHHNFFGVYTSGGQNMYFLLNEVYNNEWYGLDYHDDSDYLSIKNNVVTNNGKHGIICSKRCNNLTIVDNVSSSNKGTGIFLHKLVTDSIVSGNTTHNNTENGIAIFDSYKNKVINNKMSNNKLGIRLSVGSGNNIIENNGISKNLLYGIATFLGSDPTENGNANNVFANIFRKNIISNNGNAAIRLNDASENIIEGNSLTNNGFAVYMINAKENIFAENTVYGNTVNYFYEKTNSQNIIKDTYQFSYKLGDSLSQMSIISNDNNFWLNTKKLPVEFLPDKSAVESNIGNTSTSVIDFTKMNFIIKPDSGKILGSLSLWDINSDMSKKWTEKTAYNVNSAYHLIGDLQPSINYNIVVNGIVWKKITADALGKTSFTYDKYGAIGNVTIFEIKPAE